MKRRRWATEVVGWAAALVLVVGAGTVVSGVIDQDRLAPIVALPADLKVSVEIVLPDPEPVSTSKPRPKPKPQPVADRAPDPDLGPPPGPFPDKVPTRFAAPEDRYAFLVGMQNYRPPTHDTIASVADAALIRDTLLAAGWQSSHIKVITDSQVTGDAIRAGMRWLASVSKAGTTFTMFHYSGHVKQFGGVDDALWPIDRDWVRDTQVAQLLSRVQGKLWVDIAGCEAASFMPGLPSSDVLFSGSSKATEKSYEHPGWNASVWTGLMYGIAPGRADADADGQVVMGEALRYSQYYAQLVTLGQRPHGRQTPQVAGDNVRGWTLANPPA